MDLFTNPSPEEKLQKYNELNNMQNSDNPGYVSYIPNPGVAGKAAPLDMPKNNIGLLAPATSNINPLIAPNKVVKGDTGASTIEDIINPFKPKSASLDPPIPYVKSPSVMAKQAYQYYVNEKKLPSHVAAAIVGNLYQESGLDPTRKENNGGNGRGIAQWDVRDRWPAFRKWATDAGMNPDDLKSQLDYVLVEPGHQKEIQRTLDTTNVRDAVMAFGRGYERPNEKFARWDLRQQAANNLLSSG